MITIHSCNKICKYSHLSNKLAITDSKIDCSVLPGFSFDQITPKLADIFVCHAMYFVKDTDFHS